jgi:16S rRNA processing protein RimM
MAQSHVILGVIGRPHGVRGLLHVHSYTADPGDLAAYGPLSDGQGRQFTLAWRAPGIAALAEWREGVAVPVADRASAERLCNVSLGIARASLPPPAAEEFYLADLIGLAAIGPDGPLGAVAAVHDYGAGVSLEIVAEGQPALLLPFTHACVPEVDPARGLLRVVPPVEIAAAEVAA